MKPVHLNRRTWFGLALATLLGAAIAHSKQDPRPSIPPQQPPAIVVGPPPPQVPTEKPIERLNQLVPPKPEFRRPLPPSLPVLPDQPLAGSEPVPEITEPVATIHRFEGQYLLATGADIVRLERTASGSAIVRGPSTIGIPKSGEASLSKEVFRIVTPPMSIHRVNDRAFLWTDRELRSVNENGVDWTFTLPGKPITDHGIERLQGVIHTSRDEVHVASRFQPRMGDPSLTIYRFDRETGRLLESITSRGKFRDVPPLFDGTSHWALADGALLKINKVESQVMTTLPATLEPATRLLFAGRELLALGDKSLDSVPSVNGPASPYAGEPTARPTVGENGTVYCPLRRDGTQMLSAIVPAGSRTRWSRTMPEPVAISPALSETSLYVLSGTTLHRLHPATGSIGWRLRLPLKETDVPNELRVNEGVVELIGEGFVLRVSNAH